MCFTQVLHLPSFILHTLVAKKQLSFAQSFFYLFFAKENTVLEFFYIQEGEEEEDQCEMLLLKRIHPSIPACF